MTSPGQHFCIQWQFWHEEVDKPCSKLPTLYLNTSISELFIQIQACGKLFGDIFTYYNGHITVLDVSTDK